MLDGKKPFAVNVQIRYEYEIIVMAESKEDAERDALCVVDIMSKWSYIPDEDAFASEMDSAQLMTQAEAMGDDVILYTGGPKGEWMSLREFLLHHPEYVLPVVMPGQEPLNF
jgi:hypothetical protein